MGVDFRVINKLFDCSRCDGGDDFCIIREMHEDMPQKDRRCGQFPRKIKTMEEYLVERNRPDPAYKRKEKPDQNSDTSH